MKIEEFLAVPLAPSIRLRVGPGERDVVEIDQLTFELKKDEFINFCLGLQNIDGLSWRLLKPHTDNNGLMAKVLIALGELAGVWKMHPRPEFPLGWEGSNMYPMILAGSINRPAGPGNQIKPSRGDLEIGLVECKCCERPMAQAGSKTHDIHDAGEGFCEECEAFCEPGTVCYLNGKEKKAARSKRQEAEETEVDLDAMREESDKLFADYIKQFNEET